MRQHAWIPIMTFLGMLALTAAVPTTVGAHDRSEDHSELRAEDRHGDLPAVRRDAHREVQRRHVQRRDNRASVRCHDGYFTHGHDRESACSRHGGMDGWTAL